MTGSILIPSDEESPRDTSVGIWPVVVVGLVAAVLVVVTQPARTPESDSTLGIPATAPVGEWTETPLDDSGTVTAIATVDERLVVVGAGRRIDDPPLAAVVEGTAVEWSVGEWDAGDVISAMAQTAEGLVAVGHRLDPSGDLGETEPAVWVSGDGRRWAATATMGLPPTGSIHAITSTPRGLVAIGWTGPTQLEPAAPPAAGAEGRVWTSNDGVRWEDTTPAGGAWFEDVTTDGATALVVGRIDGTATVWFIHEGGEVAVPGPEAGTLATTGIIDGDTALVVVRPLRDPEGIHTTWRVRGDGTWSDAGAASGPDTAGWITEVAGGFLVGSPFSRSVYSTGPELHWTEDGTRWDGIQVTSGRSPWPPTQVTTALVAADGSIVAAGSRGGRPAVWTLERGAG